MRVDKVLVAIVAATTSRNNREVTGIKIMLQGWTFIMEDGNIS